MARQLEHFDNLVSLFLTRAAEKGDAPFLWAKREGEWRSISWAEAARQVAALAASLKRIGLQPGDRVALVSENRPEWLIADLAIMAAGCVTVPTYTTNTDARSCAYPRQFGRAGGDRLQPEARQEPRAGGADLERMPPRHRHRGDPLGPGARLGQLSIAGRSWHRGDADVAALRETRRRRSAATISPASSTPAAPAARRAACSSTTARSSHNLEGCTDIISTDFGWGDEVFLSFLPASHAYEHTGGQHFPIALGAQIYYAESLEKLAANIEEVQPTIMVVVPRLFEMLRARIIKSIEAQRRPVQISARPRAEDRRRQIAGGVKPWDLPMDGILSLTLRREGAREDRRPGQRPGSRAARRSTRKSASSSSRSGSPSSRATARPRRGRSSAATGRAPASGSIPSARPSRTPKCGSPRTARSWCAARIVMHGYWRNHEETRAGAAGRLARDRRRRPFRREGPDRHHRPQEGPDRQRQGRQCLAAADRGDADAAARDRAGDGLWRPPAAPRRAARARSGDRVKRRPARSGFSARSTGSMPICR